MKPTLLPDPRRIAPRVVARRRTLQGVALALAVPAAFAQTSPAAAPSAWIDPQAPTPPPPPVDIAPVMRAPAVDTLATIRQRGAMRVGIVQVPPMVMLDRQGRLVGFSVDLARKLADDIGVQLEFVEASWASIIPELVDRRTDLVATGLWMIVPRALVVNFTRPTATEGIYLFGSRSRAAGRRALASFDRPGATIAVSSDPAQLQVAKARFPRATVVPMDDDPMRALAGGRVQAALLATLSAEAVVAAAPDRWVLISPEPLARTSAAMAVRKGDPDFLAFLDTWLEIQRESGWLAERTRHWSTSTEGFR